MILAYFFDNRFDWLNILKRTATDSRFGNFKWHASRVDGGNVGTGHGTIIRTDPRAQFFADAQKTELWDWRETEENGLFLGMIKNEFADRFTGCARAT